jgi:hypothetical protein
MASMEMFSAGDQVEHPDYGTGTIETILGSKALVKFFGGGRAQIEVDELQAPQEKASGVVAATIDDPQSDRTMFRRALEAVNLGAVPPDAPAIRDLTIEGNSTSRQVKRWLGNANKHGLCKVAFGYYGAGKSHYLHLAKAVALEAGWAVSYIEFDPKSADPAKPQLVYRALTEKLEFPAREDGSVIYGLRGLLREAWKEYARLKDLPLLRSSRWFSKGLETLRYCSPREDDEEFQTISLWLEGHSAFSTAVRKIARNYGVQAASIPAMPATLETAEIYVFHIAVLGELCRALGYRGLLLIIDEAEHVRGFNVKRRERANTFFDILARSAHVPLPTDPPPRLNDHGLELPEYWRKGPHFGLLVGLTPGDIFSDPDLPLREACVFLFGPEDKIVLEPPSADAYESWCEIFFEKFSLHYPEYAGPLKLPENRHNLASVLAQEFAKLPVNDRIVRIWVKLACLVPSILMVHTLQTFDHLSAIIRIASQEATVPPVPWDNGFSV